MRVRDPGCLVLHLIILCVGWSIVGLIIATIVEVFSLSTRVADLERVLVELGVKIESMEAACGSAHDELAKLRGDVEGKGQ